MSQSVDVGVHVEMRALSQLGVGFRLHGREAGRALDCIGLAAFALAGDAALREVPSSYHFRGHYQTWLEDELSKFGMLPCLSSGSVRRGDLTVFKPSARQIHLGIEVKGGVVHAHAGLRKVVLTPNPHWKTIGRWRLKGT